MRFRTLAKQCPVKIQSNINQPQARNQLSYVLSCLIEYLCFATILFTDFDAHIGKLPEGSSKINRLSLNRCPPYTEIFSKRRKIYAVCVESLSMPTHRIKQWVVKSCIQIKFVNVFFAETKDRLGTK